MLCNVKGQLLQKEVTSVEVHQQVCKNLTSLYARKNHDYGDSFHKSYVEFGETMLAIRLDDKLNRYKTLIKVPAKDRKVLDESLQDTLMDLANYAIMGLMEMGVFLDDD